MHAHLPLHALDALLSVAPDADPFPLMFEALKDALGFDQALVLEADAGAVRCFAASPPQLAELRWHSGAFFRDRKSVV